MAGGLEGPARGPGGGAIKSKWRVRGQERARRQLFVSYTRRPQLGRKQWRIDILTATAATRGAGLSSRETHSSKGRRYHRDSLPPISDPLTPPFPNDQARTPALRARATSSPRLPASHPPPPPPLDPSISQTTSSRMKTYPFLASRDLLPSPIRGLFLLDRGMRSLRGSTPPRRRSSFRNAQARTGARSDAGRRARAGMRKGRGRNRTEVLGRH